MNPIKLLVIISLAITVLVAPAAHAYEIDPLTRRPLVERSTDSVDSDWDFNFNPMSFRKSVKAPGNYAPGTIVISTQQRKLYLITSGGNALQYGIGVGRSGFTWGGKVKITAKKEWPGWTPPPAMRKRRPGLPSHMKGGINNPLGARALYLGSTIYRIHGSNEPDTIGQAVSSGCFRLTNNDIIDLYKRVHVGTPVIILR